ncbi:MAG: peptidoglycan DD-metalloendopeptidase family protein [Desulfobacteraceae bacterium]|nr:peptidoglycan DD-metalloendopeptidase family protein [Desulfobacteraceae bacterium]
MKQKNKVLKLNLEKQSVLNEISKYDEKIARQWKALNDIEKKKTEMELQLLDTQKRYKGQLDALQGFKHRVELRLTAISRVGATGILNVFFSASTIPEMISNENYLKFILDNDQSVRAVYLDGLKRSYKVRDEIEKEKKALEDTSQSIKKQVLLLEGQKKERRSYLAEVKRQTGKHEKMLGELQEAERSLQAVVAGLDQKEYAAGGGVNSTGHAKSNSFSGQKGKLQPPVEGPAGRPDVGRRVPGIVIQAPFGTEIRAIFDGTVVYCNNLPGYGNVLIINHGNGYYSLTAQGAKFFKSVGDKVVEGDIVGLTGSGPWIREGIYFELRHGRLPENPFKWLNIKK